MPDYLTRNGGARLAYVRSVAQGPGAALPGVMFLGGFRSDMTGTKATDLEARCSIRGQGFLRFDYGGHGASAGRFDECTLESWRGDALAVLDRLTDGPVILVGSSMGGWIALLLALARPDRVCGLIGLAAAPDFTRSMVDEKFDDALRLSLETRGFADIPNDYSDEPYRITRGLIESGNRVCLLDRDHDLSIPVRLIQGKNDADVPWQTAQKIADRLPHADVRVHLVDDGDHRLSRPQDLDLIDATLRELSMMTRKRPAADMAQDGA